MEQKFYLNKIIKLTNIEYYTLSSLKQLRKCYDQFIEDTNGTDPDFPTLNFGGNGKSVKGTNVFNVFGDDPDFEGIKGLSNDKLT